MSGQRRPSPDRDARIIKLAQGPSKLSVETLAERFGLSKHRVRCILAAANSEKEVA